VGSWDAAFEVTAEAAAAVEFLEVCDEARGLGEVPIVCKDVVMIDEGSVGVGMIVWDEVNAPSEMGALDSELCMQCLRARQRWKFENMAAISWM
jgi:hypothetical protein